jgi:hypothetical protein
MEETMNAKKNVIELAAYRRQKGLPAAKAYQDDWADLFVQSLRAFAVTCAFGIVCMQVSERLFFPRLPR